MSVTVNESSIDLDRKLLSVLNEINVTLREIKNILTKIVEYIEEDRKLKIFDELEKTIKEIEKEET